MSLRWHAPLLIALGILCTFANSACGDLVYLIGNSLTWDTRPQLLNGTVEYHVDCGRNLQYIHDNPSAPCVGSSRIWTDALVNTQYDWLSVQPHAGTTLDQDATVISEWMALQPSATLVMHTGWSFHVNHEAEYHGGNPNNRMRHSPEYFADLVAELHVRNPNRKIVSTHAIDVLDEIYHDIEDGAAPFTAFSDLYRDDTHMTTSGRFLVHNLMRHALNQPISDVGFDGLQEDVKTYLLSKIQSVVPEPSGFCLAGCFLAVLGLRFSNRLRRQ